MIDLRAGRLAIINTNNVLSVDGVLGVHLQGTLELHNKRAFHASRKGDAAGDSFGLDGFDLFDSAAGIKRLLDDFVGGLASRGRRQKQEYGDGKESGFHWWLAVGSSKAGSGANFILEVEAFGVKCVARRGFALAVGVL